MYENKKLAVVIPAYNEELLLESTLSSIPNYVDDIIVINDCSTDSTASIIKQGSLSDKRIFTITNSKNRGVGFAIKKGYEKAYSLKSEITIVIAGDGQMDTKYIPKLIEPIIEGNADYTKGDRLTSGERKKMPLFRLFGNSILTLLTKISTGYWDVIDPQNGYTAISNEALGRIINEKITDGYGNPNDFLIALNVHNLRVKDIVIPPIYGKEKSGIKIPKFIFKTFWILSTGFFRRINKKYGGLHFHPIWLFYYFGFLLFASFIVLAHRVYSIWSLEGNFPDLSIMLAGISFLGSLQLLLNALWLDSQFQKNN